jgi:hypothetical protein
MSQEHVGDGAEEESWEEWIGALDDVLDAAIDREKGIECTCEDLRVDVPLRMGPDAERARWEFDGTVRVHVDGAGGPLAEWLRWWYRKLPSGTGGEDEQ